MRNKYWKKMNLGIAWETRVFKISLSIVGSDNTVNALVRRQISGIGLVDER